jgi:electron transport complex protein RnfG
MVLILALAFGATLAGVQVGLEDRIEANLRAETLSRIPELVLGAELGDDAEVAIQDNTLRVARAAGPTLEIEVEERQISGHQTFEVTGSEDGERLGWVVRGAGQGYADLIEVLVGLDASAAEITGLYVLSQKETPGLGDAIKTAGFRSRFIGASTRRPVTVTKNPEAAASDASQILALTAATISSQSVSDIVNRTVAEVRADIEPPS